MFYCEKCRIEHNYPESIRKSKGTCELCDCVTDCHDVPSNQLPKPEEKTLEQKAEQFIKDCNVFGAVHALEGGVIELSSLLVDFVKLIHPNEK